VVQIAAATRSIICGETVPENTGPPIANLRQRAHDRCPSQDVQYLEPRGSSFAWKVQQAAALRQRMHRYGTALPIHMECVQQPDSQALHRQLIDNSNCLARVEYNIRSNLLSRLKPDTTQRLRAVVPTSATVHVRLARPRFHHLCAEPGGLAGKTIRLTNKAGRQR